MAEETKTRFTFSFFDAAHTDGYVAQAKKEFKRNDNQLTSQRGGFFSDEEEDEYIVTKIHHWKQIGKDSKTKPPQKRLDIHDLFSETVNKERAYPESDDTVPTADIQLNRLLDNYMLGEKGDRIMQQMESFTKDDPPSPVQKFPSQSQDNLNDGSQKIVTDRQEPPLDLDAMISMDDFQKYIDQN